MVIRPRGSRPKDSFESKSYPETGRQIVLARPKSALLPDAISFRIEANRQNRGRGGSIGMERTETGTR
jgi:hypothetical protein